MLNVQLIHPVFVAIVAWLMLTAGCSSGKHGRWFFQNRPPSNEPAVLNEHQELDVQLSLGRALEQQQQWDAARMVYARILAVHPRHAQATHRTAIMYDRQGDFVRSSKWFHKALQVDPGSADVLCDLGYSLYLQGNLQQAEMKLRRAIALRPDHQRTHNHLGLVLANTDRREEALDAFRQAGCTPSEAHLNAAVVFAMNQKTAEAWAEVRRAGDAAPHASPEHQRRFKAVHALIARRERLPPLQTPNALAGGSYVHNTHHETAAAFPVRTASGEDVRSDSTNTLPESVITR